MHILVHVFVVFVVYLPVACTRHSSLFFLIRTFAFKLLLSYSRFSAFVCGHLCVVCLCVCVPVSLCVWGKCCIAAVSPRAINCQWQLHVGLATSSQHRRSLRSDLATDTRILTSEHSHTHTLTHTYTHLHTHSVRGRAFAWLLCCAVLCGWPYPQAARHLSCCLLHINYLWYEYSLRIRNSIIILLRARHRRRGWGWTGANNGCLPQILSLIKPCSLQRVPTVPTAAGNSAKSHSASHMYTHTCVSHCPSEMCHKDVTLALDSVKSESSCRRRHSLKGRKGSEGQGREEPFAHYKRL